VQALCETLAALAPTHAGRLPEPLRAGITPPTAAELESWTRLPAGVDELALAGVAPRDPDAARDYYLRTFAEPALDVNGITGGSPVLEKTVLPVAAEANVSMRLAPGQQVEPIVAAFRELVAAAVPTGAELEVELRSTARPGIIDPDARAVALGQDAFQRALGVRPLLVRSGGTLPIVATHADLKIPTIITGFSLPDANIHSPNERLLVEYIERGIVAARELFTEFAAL
jgi:acetylornithine deacetylase/succinyl-diaminopimelate desuccinylase-like protein